MAFPHTGGTIGPFAEMQSIRYGRCYGFSYRRLHDVPGDFSLHILAIITLLRLDNINLHTANLFPPGKSFLSGPFEWQNRSLSGMSDICGLVVNNLSHGCQGICRHESSANFMDRYDPKLICDAGTSLVSMRGHSVNLIVKWN